MWQPTERDDAVLGGLERGLSYAQIAAELGLSESGVRSRVHTAYRHSGTACRSQLLRAYRRSRAPAAAAILHGDVGQLSVDGWRRVVLLVLDALEEA